MSVLDEAEASIMAQPHEYQHIHLGSSLPHVFQGWLGEVVYLSRQCCVSY